MSGTTHPGGLISLPPMQRPNPRLASIDALRGWAVAAMILVNNPGDWGHVWWPLEHAEWHGCTPTDLIFPGFLFIVGVSLAFATGPKRDRGETAGLAGALWWRAMRIVLLGLVLHAVAHWAMDTRAFRPFGVLQRIGLCFGLAGSVAALLPRGRWPWLFIALLLGYGALLLAPGGLQTGSNAEARVDSWLLGRYAYQWDAATDLAFDPEGPVGLLGALATTLLGLIAGETLRRGALQRLWAFALVALTLGALGSLVWPWNKSLWTPSFVLWAGGWATLALALFHRLIDRQGLPPLGQAFGLNAITAYAGAWLLTCLLEGTGWGTPLYAHAFAWMTPWTGPLWPSHLWALAGVAVWWAVTKLMQRRGWVVTI